MPSYKRDLRINGRTADEIYEKVQGGIENFLSKTPIGKHEISKDPEKRVVSVKSGMFSGDLICSDGLVKVDASLSFMAMPFRSKLDEGLDKWVAKTFGA
ncbi:MAG TPA: hypothetical protein VL588_10450 [Bdellovibrionota bacterium]|jgi:hypothetical protein|nr:hypothetical protein [Bdellovibrionota bacterium]